MNEEKWVKESLTISGLNARIGPGPTQRFQSKPGGGAQLGSWPMPSTPRFSTLKVRATLILPSMPERIFSTTFG